MSNVGEELIITGAWFLLFGTVTSAVGVTSKHIIGTNFGKKLFAKGNAIEAFGNSIQSVGREKLIKSESGNGNNEHLLTILLGSWIQAAGNATNTLATELEISGSIDQGEKLNALGSVIQSIGASFEAKGARQEEGVLVKFEVFGNELIAIGAMIDGIGNVALLNQNDAVGEQLLFFGSWVQVLGSILIVFAVTNSIESEEETKGTRYGYYPKI
ncbi:hypothetical protein V7056_14850 [Bacillus sp. JJ664]